MKKILTVILAVALVLSFAACGDKGKDGSTGNADVKVDNVSEPNNPDGDKAEAPDENNGEQQADNGENKDVTPENNTDDAQGEVPGEVNEEDPNKTTEEKTEEKAEEKNEEKPADKPDEKVEENTEEKPTEKPEEIPAVEDDGSIPLPKVSKQTLVDTEVCKFTVTGIKNDSFFGPTLLCELENKSKDVSYVFSIKDSYINDVYTPMYLYSEVAPGKKSNEEISLSLDDMIKYGLTKITDIEITLEVKDSNSSRIDPPVVLQTVSLQPYGKGQVSKFNVGNDVIKNVYIDNKYAKISALSYYKNEMYGYCIDLFIENKSDANISVKFENTSVNGKLLDPYVYEVVNQGKSSIARVDWPISEFEENGFTTFKEIKFTLVIANNGDVSGKSYSSDEIVLSFGG